MKVEWRKEGQSNDGKKSVAIEREGESTEGVRVQLRLLSGYIGCIGSSSEDKLD